MLIERMMVSTAGSVPRFRCWLAGAAMAAALYTGHGYAQIGPGLASEETVRAIMQSTTVHARGLSGPRGLLFAPGGDLLVAEQGGGTVARISPDGKIKRVGGFRQPHDVAIDAKGNLYVADAGNNRIAMVMPDGKVSSWVEGLKNPVDLAFNAAGELVVCEYGANRVVAYAAPDKRRVLLTGFKAHGLALAADGALYINDVSNKRVLKLVAGGKPEVMAEDMPLPIGIAIGQSGGLFVALREVGKVVRITKGGKKLTILDRLKSPRDPVLDRDGNLYVAETATGRILKLAGRF
jgi:sugar lactone lactonase YvrE